MTKIVNLDKVETKIDKAIILNGKEHFMKTLTVKEYILQMKESEKIEKLAKDTSINGLAELMDLSINSLLKIFPTVKREEFEALSLDQLNAVRELADETATNDLETDEVADEAGESSGKAD